MFRRKDTSTSDPLPFGLRTDLLKAGEKLAYRARTFHSPFGKDAESLQRAFLNECRLSILVFLNRKGALGPLDHAVYAAAFPDSDIQADIKTLLPRAALRSLGQSFVLARQRGLTRADTANLTETEQATLDALWNIIELALILPGNRGGREFINSEQARVKTLLADRFQGGTDRTAHGGALPGMSRHPTLSEEDRPKTPTFGGLDSQLADPRPQPESEHHPSPELPVSEPSPRVGELFDSFRWAEAFGEQTVDVEGGKFFMPPQVAGLLDQASQRRHTARQLLSQAAARHFLQSQLHVAEQYQLFMLGAFLDAGPGVSVRDLRVLSRVSSLPAGFLNLQGWQALGQHLRNGAASADIARFVPEALLSIAQRTEREVAEDFISTVIEELLVTFDALLALGRDDDGARADFRGQVYDAQRQRSEQYLSGSAARAREQLPASPSLPTALLGQVLGERFKQLRTTLAVPARSEEHLEILRDDFARHFQVLFATAVRLPGPVAFGHHSVALLSALTGETRSRLQWQTWHDEALVSFALDPFVFRPEYLRDLVHAASASSSWRTSLEKLLGTTRNLIETYVEDVVGGLNHEDATSGFARLQAAIDEHLAPMSARPEEVAPVPKIPVQDTGRSPENKTTPQSEHEAAPETFPGAQSALPENKQAYEAPAPLPVTVPTVPVPSAPVIDVSTPPAPLLEDEGWNDDDLTPQRPAAPDLSLDFTLDLPSHLPSPPKGTGLALEIDLPVPGHQEGAPPEVSVPLPAGSAQAQSSRLRPEHDDIAAVLHDVMSLVGQEDLKRQFQQIADQIQVRETRRAGGLPTADFSLHLALTGKRGTGRTTAAHLLARLYRAAGLLSRGHVTEVLATDLMAGEPLENMQAVEHIVERAMGGVLLIDRAYTLAEHDSSGGHVISVFLRLLERQREDLAVIIAGKHERLEYFQTYNDAMRARFSRMVQLGDFTAAELAEILSRTAQRQGYHLDDEARNAAREAFERLARSRDQDVSLLEVPAVLEGARARQANRVATLAQVTQDDLSRLKAQDF